MDKLEKLEYKIAKFLRYGVIFSGILIFTGWFWNIKFNADPFYNFQVYDRFPLRNILTIYYKTQNWAMLLSYLGLMSLISLPIIRVLLTAWLFFRQKERILAFVAVAVFLALVASFTLGIEL